jgi:hypothetical protein
VTRKPLKRLAVVTLLLAVLGLSPVAVFLVVKWQQRAATGRELDARLAELDRDDPTWRIGEVVKPHNATIPSDETQNATLVGLNALGLRPAAWKERQDAIYASPVPEIPDIEFDDDRLPRDGAICSLLEVHFQSDEANRLVLSTRAMPAGGLMQQFNEPDPFGTLLPKLQPCREVASLLKDYATAEAYLGHPDAALAAAATAAHYADVSLRTDPLLISQLIRDAMLMSAAGSAQQALAWGEPTAELAATQAEFERAATVDGLTPALRGERACITRIFENVRSGALPRDYFDRFDAMYNGGSAPSPLEQVRSRLGFQNLARNQLDVLTIDNDYLAACLLRDSERRAAFAKIHARSHMVDFKYLPAMQKCLDADDRTRARLRCAAVGIACERTRRKTGRFPATLADIPKDILAAVPTDPFSGKPLSYCVFEDGAAVFTVGPDGKCDGVAAPSYSNDVSKYFVFRLWNPDARRRPPTVYPWELEMPLDDAPLGVDPEPDAP